MEKANEMMKHQILQNIIMKLVRFMEMFIFLAMISKSSSQLPSAVHVSVDYLRGITLTMFGYFSPKFVFVIVNLIILILFFKSRTNDRNRNDDLCNEYVKRYDTSVKSYATVIPTTPANVIVHSNTRPICRSKSESKMIKNRGDDQTHRELRRSVTELSRPKNFGDAGGGGAAAAVVGDNLSCDEFRRTVDAFIARRQKLLRDEEFSPMVYIGS
ncbi:hypothetical protein E3N88_08887 [Mikania micrantha]|uniref:DUF4408 domain-containing protein n=1 Tax=Mikania micrantha TaxID=192012 RepID=A0A5N6PJI9_9ASTR|nr:hypothetical protein E3N88_08887 [Mikania micrantha]